MKWSADEVADVILNRYIVDNYPEIMDSEKKIAVIEKELAKLLAGNVGNGEVSAEGPRHVLD